MIKTLILINVIASRRIPFYKTSRTYERILRRSFIEYHVMIINISTLIHLGHIIYCSYHMSYILNVHNTLEQVYRWTLKVIV